MLAKEDSTTKTPKIKYIWHICRTATGIHKSKYTVVYENKTYYYCKENGSDMLIHVSKSRVKDKYSGEDYGHFSCDIDLSNDELALAHKKSCLLNAYRSANSAYKMHIRDAAIKEQRRDEVAEEYKKLFGHDIREDL